MQTVGSLDPEHVAVIVGGLVLLGVYYVVGARYLGPDDDFWSPLRRWLLPRVDDALARFGGYAQSVAPDGQRVGIVNAPPEEVEAALYEQGYRWNFASSLKRDPKGRVEYASWSKRQVRNPVVRDVLEAVEGIRVLGTPVELVEAAVARRQDHATLFRTPAGTTVYAHEEPNALNPLLFVAHYLGGRVRDLLGQPVESLSVRDGIETVAADLEATGLPFSPSERATSIFRAWNGGHVPGRGQG